MLSGAGIVKIDYNRSVLRTGNIITFYEKNKEDTPNFHVMNDWLIKKIMHAKLDRVCLNGL